MTTPPPDGDHDLDPPDPWKHLQADDDRYPAEDAQADAGGEHAAADAPEVVGAPDVDEPDGTGPDAAGATGRRAARRRRHRRRRRARRVVVVLGIVAVVAVVRLVPWDMFDRADPQPQPQAAPSASPAPPEQDTLLVVRTEADDGAAAGVTLLTAGADPVSNAVIFIPEGTLIDIPGFGIDRLGLAQQYGGPALVEASVENLLGIDVDATAQVSNSGLSALLARTGGLDLDLEERLVARNEDGSAEVRFEPGAQFLDGPRLVEYWSFRERGDSELDTFPRQQQVWAQLLGAAGDPAVVDALLSDGAPQLDTPADPAFLRSVLTQLAEATAAGTLDYIVVPVTPFGAEDDSGGVTYRPDPDGIAGLVAQTLAASVPAGGGAEAVRIQVLNGVGTPGIGQEVDRKLEGAGFRIVLTDNARSFDFDETRILVYREDEESLAAAEQVQRRLGVGTIAVSRQPQSVVDLTIVVGSDFLESVAGDTSPRPQEQSS